MGDANGMDRTQRAHAVHLTAGADLGGPNPNQDLIGSGDRNVAFLDLDPP